MALEEFMVEQFQGGDTRKSPPVRVLLHCNAGIEQDAVDALACGLRAPTAFLASQRRQSGLASLVLCVLVLGLLHGMFQRKPQHIQLLQRSPAEVVPADKDYFPAQIFECAVFLRLGLPLPS